MPQDVLAEICALDGVAEAAAAARAAVDEVLWDRALRPKHPEMARTSLLRGAWAAAALDGAEVPWASVAADEVEDSPMGDQVRRAIAVNEAIRGLVEVHDRAPMQAWARLNTIAAAGAAGQDSVGRPRRNELVADPLRLGPVPPAGDVSDRLVTLATVLTSATAAPALVVAAVAHAELAVLRPFAVGSGSLARASTRLILAGRGVDPDLVTIPESGLLSAGRAKYVTALKGFAGATPAGVGAWVAWFCQSVQIGARQAGELARPAPSRPAD